MEGGGSDAVFGLGTAWQATPWHCSWHSSSSSKCRVAPCRVAPQPTLRALAVHFQVLLIHRGPDAGAALRAWAWVCMPPRSGTGRALPQPACDCGRRAMRGRPCRHDTGSCPAPSHEWACLHTQVSVLDDFKVVWLLHQEGWVRRASFSRVRCTPAARRKAKAGLQLRRRRCSMPGGGGGLLRPGQQQRGSLRTAASASRMAGPRGAARSAAQTGSRPCAGARGEGAGTASPQRRACSAASLPAPALQAA